MVLPRRRVFPHEDIYRGVMEQVACSRVGWLLAQATRLIGTPLAPFSGRQVPTFVVVYPDPRGGGTIWDRVYAFPGKRPVTVRSSKQLDRRGRMVERVGGGFGMELRVFEAGESLHFVSERYFFEILGLRLALPHLLSPGRAHVLHQDLGGGRFRFRLTVRHPLFGTSFEQEGIFRDEPAETGGPGPVRAA